MSNRKRKINYKKKKSKKQKGGSLEDKILNRIPKSLMSLLKNFNKSDIISTITNYSIIDGLQEEIQDSQYYYEKPNKKIMKIIETFNRNNLPNLKSKKNILICHSKSHVSNSFNLLKHNPSKNINDYITIDPQGMGPHDVAIDYTKHDIKNLFPQKHYTYAATIFCPNSIYKDKLKRLFKYILKDGAIVEILGFQPKDRTKIISNFFELEPISKGLFKFNRQKGGNGMCSPSLVDPTSAGKSNYNYSCFTLKDLKDMAKMVNRKYKSKIPVNSFKASDKAKLIKEIHYALKCGDMSLDMCVLKNYSSDFDKTIRKNFKPKSPKGKEEWLSSIDIYDVMEQYMQKHPDFIFLGPVPIDFSDFSNALSRINLKKLYKNKKRIGIVFNTDPSYKSGEHWISMFIDLSNKTICFFDSVSDGPPKEVKKFMNKIIKQAKNIGLTLKPIINKKQHQRGNNECGVYSLYFIISRLEGKSCEYINNKIIPDKKMNKYRQKFFRPNV